MGYTEPLRRFIQPEGYTPQVNEIPNTMPSWMPGEDYLINFRKGDPYIKVDEGYARLPGTGYEALHPELEGLKPEDYPDIAKMRILGDVAPYSREYQKYASRVRAQSRDNPGLEAEYDRIAEQVRQTKESTLQVAQRHFNAPVDTIEGTVKSASMTDQTRCLPAPCTYFPARGGGPRNPAPGAARSHRSPATLFMSVRPVSCTLCRVALRHAACSALFPMPVDSWLGCDQGIYICSDVRGMTGLSLHCFCSAAALPNG